MYTGSTISGTDQKWQLTDLYEDTPAGMVWHGRAQEGTPEAVLIASPAYAVGDQGQKRLAADAAVWQTLTDRPVPGTAVALHDWGAQPRPFLVVEPPVRNPLEELATEGGPLPEREALVYIDRLAALLHVLHDDLNCALARTALKQVRWDRKAEQLWLPLWHELAHAPTPERWAYDVGQLGALLHELLLGRPALNLWGLPVLVDEQPPANSPASRGTWRLLRRLLHPNPAQRLTSVAKLTDKIERLMTAWDGEPSALLDQAECLIQEAEAGALEPAEQADALLAILDCRAPDLPDLDSMQDDVAALLAHKKTIDTAVELARGRSLTLAVEKLRPTAADTGNSLALVRWAAVLETPGILQMLDDAGASQHLRAVVDALQRGDLDAAQAALAALPQAPPGLGAEVAVRTAWRDAINHANDPAAALFALDKASATLGALTDANLRVALDAALGGLAHWRQVAAVYLATAAEAARRDDRIARLQSLRQGQRWVDACNELHTAVGLDPADRALAAEARRLAIDALAASQPEIAAEAFALAAADPTERRLAQIGWRVARALAALLVDPLGEFSLAQVQLAVERCRPLTVQNTGAQESQQHLANVLEKGLEQAAVAAGDISSVDGRRAAQVLAGALHRLTTGEDPSVAQPDPLQILEDAIELALAADTEATRALLARRLEPAPVAMPVPAEKPLAAPPTQAQIDRMVQRLISIHFDEVETALIELAQGALGEVGAAKLAPLVIEAKRAIGRHKDAMAEVDRLASNDQKDQAKRILHDATRSLRSRKCWDPTLSNWVPVDQWQARLDPLLAALMSNDPRLWSKVLATSASGRSMWSKTVRNLAQQRTKEIASHRSEIEDMYKKLDSNPIDVKERFQAWRRQHSDWVVCWDARAKDWVDVDKVEQRVLRLGYPAHEP